MIKSHRQEIIRSLITGRCIQSQDELQKLLSQQGIDVTQATLSRDLREMGLVKAHDSESGIYCYQEAGRGKVLPIAPSRNRFTLETIKSVEFSGNQGIVKTYPGFAGAVASVIDDNVHSGIMGTLAGDDVVLMILREGACVEDLVREISLYIAGFDTKLIQNS